MNSSKIRTLSRKILISCGNHMMNGFDRHRSINSSDVIEGLKKEFIQKVDSYLEVFGATLDSDSWKIVIPQHEIEVFIHPLDDHVSYRHGLERFASGLFLKQEGEICISAVFAPYFQELYFAERGKGLKRNNAQVSLEKTKSISNSIVTLVSPNTSTFTDADVLLMKMLSSYNSQVQITTSPLFTCSRVVNGNITAAFFRDISDDLIDLMSYLLDSSDGQLFTANIGGQLYYIAANQGVVDPLLELVAETLPSNLPI